MNFLKSKLHHKSQIFQISGSKLNKLKPNHGKIQITVSMNLNLIMEVRVNSMKFLKTLKTLPLQILLIISQSHLDHQKYPGSKKK